jgi:hypothetical protein
VERAAEAARRQGNSRHRHYAVAQQLSLSSCRSTVQSTRMLTREQRRCATARALPLKERQRPVSPGGGVRRRGAKDNPPGETGLWGAAGSAPLDVPCGQTQWLRKTARPSCGWSVRREAMRGAAAGATRGRERTNRRLVKPCAQRQTPWERQDPQQRRQRRQQAAPHEASEQAHCGSFTAHRRPDDAHFQPYFGSCTSSQNSARIYSRIAVAG